MLQYSTKYLLKKPQPHLHVTPSHTSRHLSPTLKIAYQLKQRFQFIKEGLEPQHAGDKKRTTFRLLCRFLRGLAYPKIQWCSALAARQYVTDGIDGHLPSQRTSSSDSNSKNLHPKKLYAKFVCIISFAKGGGKKKPMTTAAVCFQRNKRKNRTVFKSFNGITCNIKR